MIDGLVLQMRLALSVPEVHESVAAAFDRISGSML